MAPCCSRAPPHNGRDFVEWLQQLVSPRTGAGPPDRRPPTSRPPTDGKVFLRPQVYDNSSRLPSLTYALTTATGANVRADGG
eukprot:463317-Prorocentrum_minimum.AAC.1